MTIKKITPGNILAPSNKSDIIIGMNVGKKDVTGIGYRFVKNQPTQLLPHDLGTVISYAVGDGRYVHMIICHRLGKGGWKDADKYLRYGLDHLWHTEGDRKYSIVEIGTGRIGTRDGADAAALKKAMTDTHLELELYVFDPKEPEPTAGAVDTPRLRAERIWTARGGVQEMRLAA